MQQRKFRRMIQVKDEFSEPLNTAVDQNFIFKLEEETTALLLHLLKVLAETTVSDYAL